MSTVVEFSVPKIINKTVEQKNTNIKDVKGWLEKDHLHLKKENCRKEQNNISLKYFTKPPLLNKQDKKSYL